MEVGKLRCVKYGRMITATLLLILSFVLVCYFLSFALEFLFLYCQ